MSNPYAGTGGPPPTTFNNAKSLFDDQGRSVGANNGIVRKPPSSTMMGQGQDTGFDMNALMDYYNKHYPGTDPMALQQFVNAQVQRHNMTRNLGQQQQTLSPLAHAPQQSIQQ